MCARHSPTVATAFLLALATTASGCRVFNPESCTEDPPTIQPLEPVMLSTTVLPWPDLATTTTRATLSVAHRPRFGGHYECESRGYVLVSIQRVWDALADPATTHVLNQAGTDGAGASTNLDLLEPQILVDPLSLSSVAFRVFYKTDTHNSIVPVIKFDIISRMGWLQGSMQDPIELGFRSHKTCGTTHIQVMDGSIVARPVPPEDLPPGVTDATAIEQIYYLEADTQTQQDCDDTLRNHWQHQPGDEPGGLLYWLETH
jgi:hypothetical protein